MHPRVIAQRQSDAHGRIVAAVKQIAVATGVTPFDLTAIREKSPDVQRVKEYEALADWLEALQKRTKPVVEAKTARKAVKDE